LSVLNWLLYGRIDFTEFLTVLIFLVKLIKHIFVVFRSWLNYWLLHFFLFVDCRKIEDSCTDVRSLLCRDLRQL